MRPREDGRYDLIVIGAGPAGHKAAMQGAKEGKRVLLVERARSVGGECVHRGTIPSKTLRESAVSLQGLRTKSAGQLLHELSPDMEVKSLMNRLASVIQGHEAFLVRQLARNKVEIWHGHARFVSDREISVTGTDRSVRSASGAVFLVATGSRPRTPPGVPIDFEHILDSDSILSLIYLPETLTVIGAGVIASEFASIFASLGVKVVMVDKGDRPVRFLDPELTERFLRNYQRNGGVFLPNRNMLSMEWDGVSSVVTRLEGGEEIRTQKAMVALGRTANVRGLGLEAAGVETTQRGLIAVDENYRTNVPHIYAAGDVIGPPSLAASSMAQGRHAIRHALGLRLDTVAETTPVGIYTIPEMSSVGMSEEEAREKTGGCLVGRAEYRELARGLINGDEEGLVKLVADASGRRLLGAHVVGEHATELIHLAQMAMVCNLELDTFVDQIFNFPTLAEGYRVAALDIVEQRSSLRRVG